MIFGEKELLFLFVQRRCRLFSPCLPQDFKQQEKEAGKPQNDRALCTLRTYLRWVSHGEKVRTYLAIYEKKKATQHARSCSG